MSPASQGGLEVEHYIGSSLISSSARIHTRPKFTPRPGNNKVNISDGYLRHRVYHAPMFPVCDCYTLGPGWNGLGLVNFPPHHKRCGFLKKTIDDERTPLSRLAIHTQGAPLIQAGKFPSQRKSNRNSSIKYKDSAPQNASDSVSVASDESSTSGHSENCLPRIIKPRKRRKKDRKPVNAPVDPTPNIGVTPVEALEDEVNGLLDHCFEDVSECEVPCPQTSLCQCQCCDPAGIWGNPGSDLTLRRSWSEPLRPTTMRPVPIRSISLSESSHWETLKGCNIDDIKTDHPTTCLEVSTEIITSPNGHRDLEIRFFSTTAPS